ncbi:hypothetical protein OHA72_53080 [Dactylosporangium sp. NBC_01737]|nr:hypothetical protein OHA72_53080 [Dactylosporangium sp. NBC_01737]
MSDFSLPSVVSIGAVLGGAGAARAVGDSAVRAAERDTAGRPER